MSKDPMFVRNGEPVFMAGTEDFVIGLISSCGVQAAFFVMLSVALNFLLADRGLNVHYSGTPFAVCEPDIVLYSAFIVGLLATLLSTLYVIVKFAKNRCLTSNVKVGIGAVFAGMVWAAFPGLFIIGMNGRLFLIPICR